MRTILTFFREATRGGFTACRSVLKVGRTTIEVVIKIIFAP